MTASSAPRSRTVDAIFLQVAWSRLIATMDAAAVTLRRTAVSALVRECNDFGLVLSDSRGRALVEPRIALAGPSNTVGYVLREFGDSIAPGDVFVTNDAWEGTGHIHDIIIVVPIFGDDGRLVGLCGSTAHAPDIGGRFIGMDNRSVFEEGVQIPLARLYERGEPNELLFKLISSNVRLPAEVLGDVEAQVAANRFVAQRVLELLHDYELDSLDMLADAILDQTEQAIRAAIETLPVGSWTAEHVVDSIEPAPVLRVRVTKEPGARVLKLDFSETTAQQEWACNLPINSTRSQCEKALATFLIPQLPPNDGARTGLEVIAPAGTIVSARHPAPTGMRHVVSLAVHSLLLRCFSQIDAGRVRADPGTPGWVVHCSGIDRRGKEFADDFLQYGGLGAGRDHDGRHCASFPVNAMNAPVEVLEERFPIHFTRRSLRDGSGGRGRWRGGLGQVIEFVVEGDAPLETVISATRVSAPPRGLDGGEHGARGAVYLNDQELDVMDMRQTLRAGDVVRLELPGGGGYGAPAERDAEAAARDERMGYA